MIISLTIIINELNTFQKYQNGQLSQYCHFLSMTLQIQIKHLKHSGFNSMIQATRISFVNFPSQPLILTFRPLRPQFS